jgi:hypothetical protein
LFQELTLDKEGYAENEKEDYCPVIVEIFL